MAMSAADAARVLDDRGITGAHVVGLSMGAAVALELAIRMPYRVKSLVLVGGSAGGPTMARPGLSAAGGTVRTVLSDSLRHRHAWPAAALFSPRFQDEHPDTVAAYMPYFAAPPRPAVDDRMAGARDRVLRTPGCTSPGPCAHAHPARRIRRDGAARRNAHMLADGIPDAELHVVCDAGHAVPLEQPAATAESLTGWVRRHATVEPTPPRRRDVIGERITRPFSLPTGTVRNTRDVAASVARGVRSHQG